VLNVKLSLGLGSPQGAFEGFVVLKSQTTATTIRIPYWMMFDRPFTPSAALLDGAGFRSAVAPGGIVSLFGTGLGGQAAGAANLPLPNDFGHRTEKITSAGATVYT